MLQVTINIERGSTDLVENLVITLYSFTTENLLFS